jgi:putative transposase
MMGVVELDAYFVRVGLPDAGRQLVERVRRESPVRKVQSRLGNVLTRYPSRKMQRAVTTESRTVEFPALIQYEYDSNVLEYYAQPVRLDLRVTNTRGKRNRLQHTPDFLLLRENEVCIEEWREESRLENLSRKHPGRFIKTERGWNCPQVETYLQSLGVRYRLRTPAEHPAVLVQNLLFLADYYTPDAEAVSAAALKSIQCHLREHNALTLADLFTLGGLRDARERGDDGEGGVESLEESSFVADDVYKAIAEGLLTYDLWNEPLSDMARSRVYRNQAALEFVRRVDDQENREDRGSDAPKICTESTRVPFSTLSPQDISRAIRRGRALDLSSQQAAAAGFSLRTLRRWRSLARAAGTDAVSRNLALIGKVKKRGNRNRKLPEAVLLVIGCVAAEIYNQPASVNVSSAYRSFVDACHRGGLQPCSYRSFCLELRVHKSIRKREGKRSAYQAAPIVWYLNAQDPIHGVRPFEYVHIDHTPLDIFLIAGETRELLGRPWLSLAIDAESRAVVGFYLSFDSPSYRSCMMVLRDIVRRHGRLPNTLVVDNGAEFRSAALQRVCELYAVSLRYRPAGQPRHGSVLERLFGTAHSQLIHNLAGNTKCLKNVRTVTKSVSPQRHAQWTLPSLYGALNKYFQDLYGTELHPAHGQPPELHLQRQLTQTGQRHHRAIRLDRAFLIETCPSVDQCGERKIDVKRGVKVHHLWYWTEAFRGARAQIRVPVRVDPWDARFCYVLLGQLWHRCVCKLAATLRRLTRSELESYFEEMTCKRGVSKRDLTPERIREWMQILDRNAFDKRLQARQAEARLIYDALALTSVERMEKEPVAEMSPSDCPSQVCTDNGGHIPVGSSQDEYDLY